MFFSLNWVIGMWVFVSLYCFTSEIFYNNTCFLYLKILPESLDFCRDRKRCIFSPE